MFTVYRSIEEVPAGFGPSAVTIGNFDGVHLGHRAIFRRVIGLAQSRNHVAAAITFDPHPTRIVAPQRVPLLLTTPARRLELLREAGLNYVLVLPFTQEVARLEPDEFVRSVLVEKMAASAVVVGANFRFGRGQAGDIRMLEALGDRFRFEVEVAEPVRARGHMISSSLIRKLLAEGQVSRAARLLGWHFRVEGNVVAGHGVGSRQTVPTLNLSSETEVIPARGVYGTCTRDLNSERLWPSVTNIGYRPTFGGTDLSIETFLLRPLDGPSPRRISVAFWRRLRDEHKFSSAEALRAQILRDVSRAETFFRRLRAGRPEFANIDKTKEPIR